MKLATRTIVSIFLLTSTVLPAAADFETGLFYYRQGNYQAAFREFSTAPTPQGNFYLSIMYEKGDGVPQDRRESLARLKLAAEQGLDVAQASLGLMYLDGMGVQADEKEGMMWLRKAAAQGLPEAVQVVGMVRQEAGTEMLALR